MKITIYSDGGARGNPGPSGIGAVLYNEKNEVVAKISRYIGEGTNNQAEYQALLVALEKAKDLRAKEVKCYLDSELVVKQLNGQYKVKDQVLAKIFLKIWNLKKDFSNISFHHVRREKNKLADQLVNEAIDKALLKK